MVAADGLEPSPDSFKGRWTALSHAAIVVGIMVEATGTAPACPILKGWCLDFSATLPLEVIADVGIAPNVFFRTGGYGPPDFDF